VSFAALRPAGVGQNRPFMTLNFAEMWLSQNDANHGWGSGLASGLYKRPIVFKMVAELMR